MAFLNKIDENEFSLYKAKVYQSLNKLDDRNLLKSQMADCISLYMCMFDIDEKQELLNKKILPICETLTDIQIKDKKDISVKVSDASCGVIHFDDSSNLKCDISLIEREKVPITHTLYHESCHFLSVEADNDKFKNWDLMTKCRGFEEILTEYYSNCLYNLDSKLNNRKIDGLYTNTVFAEDENDFLDFEIVSNRASYGSVEGFAPIVDSILHKEILDSKILGKSDLLKYSDVIENFDKDVVSITNDGATYENYKNINNSLETLLTTVMLDKYSDLSLEDTVNDYIELRENLKTYGNISLQEGIIRNLDNLMCERITGKNLEDIDEYTLSNIIDTFSNQEVLNSDNKYNGFKKILDNAWIEVSDNEDFKNKLKENIKDSSISDVYEMDNSELLRTKFTSEKANEFKKLKLGLDINPEVLADSIAFNLDEVEDILINSNFKGSSSFGDSLKILRDEDIYKFRKIFIEGDFFDKALESENIKVCADILKEVSNLSEEDIESFFTSKNDLIKDNSNVFFDSLLYTSSYKDGAKDTNKLIEGLNKIDFYDTKDSRGQNFLVFLEDRSFSCSNGRSTLGRDKANGHIGYDYDTEKEMLRTLLSNNFSLEDKDNSNRSAFDKFVERRDFTKESDKEMFKMIKDISLQLGNYDKLIDNLSDVNKGKLLNASLIDNRSLESEIEEIKDKNSEIEVLKVD